MHKFNKHISNDLLEWMGLGSKDARTGLGHGVLDPQYQDPRSEGDNFPYVTPDAYADALEADDEDNTEDFDAIRKKGLNFEPSDSFPRKQPKTVYFAEGSNRLTDCFWATKTMLAEIAAFGDSMAAIPQMSARKGAVSGGAGSFPYPGGAGTNFKRTGTLRGWSQAPPPLAVEEETLFDVNDEVDEEEHIYSLHDMAISQGKDENYATKR